jgi:hypothetical protein
MELLITKVYDHVDIMGGDIVTSHFAEVVIFSVIWTDRFVWHHGVLGTESSVTP